MTDSAAARIRFDRDGLVPVVVQDAASGDVLMLAFMNEEALRLTSATGDAHYWSRGRQTLWRKGETSGHTQAVEEIRVNCELNSLLLLVRQTGAVCHHGYPTCYYRRLSDDGALTVVREQAFNPAAVYGREPESNFTHATSPGDRLGEATRKQFGAYAYLRENDITAESNTSRLLRAPDGDFMQRIADELRELAGVLEGEHRHADFVSDLRLETSQVLYWLIVQGLRRGLTWADLRPDTALSVDEDGAEPRAMARILRAEADRWSASESRGDFAANAHAMLALAAMGCRSGGLDPLEAVEADLAELRSRPYLADYFKDEGAVDGRNLERKRNQSG